MSTTTPKLGLNQAQGADIARDYLKTQLAASLGVLDEAVLHAHSKLNLLTNPGFEVNQRGGTVTANNAYAHDRWQHLLGGTSTGTITDETTVVDSGSGHSLKWVYVQGTVNSQVDQKIEQYVQLRGKTVAFAVRLRQGVASNARPYVSDSGTKTYGAALSTTGAFVTLSVSLAIGAAATSVRVGVDLGASDTVYLDNATLVVGAAAMDYVPLHPAEDLARCMRYYEVHGGVSSSAPRLGVYASAASQTPNIGVTFAARKAVTPTLTVQGTWNLANCTGPSVTGPSAHGYAFFFTASAAGFASAQADSSDDLVLAEANP